MSPAFRAALARLMTSTFSCVIPAQYPGRTVRPMWAIPRVREAGARTGETRTCTLGYARASERKPRQLHPPSARARETGLEPATPGFGDRCASQESPASPGRPDSGVRLWVRSAAAHGQPEHDALDTMRHLDTSRTGDGGGPSHCRHPVS